MPEGHLSHGEFHALLHRAEQDLGNNGQSQHRQVEEGGTDEGAPRAQGQPESVRKGFVENQEGNGEYNLESHSKGQESSLDEGLRGSHSSLNLMQI